uniref:Uncharacterized protein n=1 Tax=Pavo cristatus TaxID=9049 RepID=A0A8C9G717_PAVCR
MPSVYYLSVCICSHLSKRSLIIKLLHGFKIFLLLSLLVINGEIKKHFCKSRVLKVMCDALCLLLLELCDRQICTLYSPRPVLEVLVVLRKISTQCHQVSEQVIASVKSRYQQWTEKTLRSRQRHNYLRMLNRLFLSPVLRLILVLITLELVNVHLVCKKNPSDYHQYLNILRTW